jgi:hypothetical protein
VAGRTDFVVREGTSTVITTVGFEKGRVGTPLAKRLAIRFHLQAHEAQPSARLAGKAGKEPISR